MLIIGPKLFFTVLPGCPNQPRIDFSYYKYVPRLICLLICGFIQGRSLATSIQKSVIYPIVGKLFLLLHSFFTCWSSYSSSRAKLVFFSQPNYLDIFNRLSFFRHPKPDSYDKETLRSDTLT